MGHAGRQVINGKSVWLRAQDVSSSPGSAEYRPLALGELVSLSELFPHLSHELAGLLGGWKGLHIWSPELVLTRNGECPPRNSTLVALAHGVLSLRHESLGDSVGRCSFEWTCGLPLKDVDVGDEAVTGLWTGPEDRVLS